MNKEIITYHQSEVEEVFQKLISDWEELKSFYLNEIMSDYDNLSDRLDYIDIGKIAQFIVDNKGTNQTEYFELFFQNVEDILNHSDQYVTELIVIGLFEGIQNVGGNEIDYHYSFQKWLKPKSRNEWDELIDSWEGKEWRIPQDERNRKQKEINKILNKKK